MPANLSLRALSQGKYLMTSVAALYVLLKLIKEQQQRSSVLFTGVRFISVAKLRDMLYGKFL